MPNVIASLEAVVGANISGLQSGLRQADRELSGFARGMTDRIQSVGASMTRLGVTMVAIAAPLAGAFSAATNQAMSFDKAMTNAGAVLGETREQMLGVRREVLALGGAAQAGPQAVADAYYTIVSGVMDTSTHLAILNEAVRASEAGQADLTATTNVLVGAMNAYNFSADQASYVSDVLTRTVAVGVGEMNDFAAALPTATTMAAQLGISFGDLGAMTAFLTTKGIDAQTATTSLRQAMVALLNPNTAMKDALHAAGYESGSAAIKALGLAGTFNKLRSVLGGSNDALVEAVGDIRAVQATLILTQPKFESFLQSFTEGIEGATDAARNLQMESAAYQIDVFNSSVHELSITVGQALLPGLTGLVNQVRPLVQSFTDWAAANPQLVQGLAAVVALVLGAGIALGGLGLVISGIGMGLSVLLSPIGLVIAGVVALAAAFATNFGGLRDIVMSFTHGFQAGMTTLKFYAQYYINQIVDLFWDDLARPIGAALASIPTDTFVALAVGLGLLAGVFAVTKVVGLVGGLAAAVQGVGAAGATALAIGIGPLAIGIGLVTGAILLAYAAIPGFKQRVDELGVTLRNAAEESGKFLVNLGLIAIRTQRGFGGSSPAGGDQSAMGPAAPFVGGQSLYGQFATPYQQAAYDFTGMTGAEWQTNPLGSYRYLGSSSGAFLPFPGRALGGDVWPGQTYRVGEDGPELFHVGRYGGSISPNGGRGGDENLADEVVRRLLAALLPGGVPSARLREVIVNRVLEELTLG